MAQVFDWLAYHAHNAPDRTALIDRHSQRTLSYRLLNERSNRGANLLRSLGVRPGDRVALLAYNSSDIIELLFACQKLGAIFVPLNWRLAAPELRAIADNCRPTVLIHGDEFSDVAADLAQGLGIPSISMRDGEDSDYERGLEAASPAFDFHAQTHDDTWLIMYTSGTTGVPKGACLTHGNVLFSTINHNLRFNLNSTSRCLTALPLFHVGGLLLFVTPLMHMGGSAVIVRQFDPAACLAMLSDKALGITDIFGVPTIFLFMSQLPTFADADLSHLARIAVGGAPAPLELLKAYTNKGVRVAQAFGMTETATTGTALAAYDSAEKLGSSGTPALHTSIRIVDRDARDVPQGEVGEIWIKGPAISPGYWNRADANAAAYTDGWFHTGDAARVDEDGYFYIVDRWKDMFISGGENVYPAEIENVLFQLPDIAEAAVIGIADERWGEVGCAFVVAKEGSALDAAAIQRFCRESLAGFKIPKHIVFIEEMPHNAAGKIVKADLRRYYKEQVAPALGA
jgi:fatty-acyl-CoA synthase